MKIIEKFNDRSLSDADRERVVDLTNAERQELVRTILVPYPRFRQARKFIADFHLPVRDGSHSRGRLGLLLGESRAGKSFTGQDYAGSFSDVVETNGIVRRVVYVEIMNEMTAKDIAVSVFQAIGNKSVPHVKTIALMELGIESAIHHKVELVIFDDIDNALASRPREVLMTLGFVKAILDADVCNVMCTGRLRLYKMLKSIPQLEGRGGLPHHMIVPYTWRGESEQIQLLLNSIDDRLPFRMKSGLGAPDVAAHFYYVSGGLIGLMMNYIEDAAALAINDGVDRIEKEHLIQAATRRKPPGERFTPFLGKLDPDRLDATQDTEIPELRGRTAGKRDRASIYSFDKTV